MRSFDGTGALAPNRLAVYGAALSAVLAAVVSLLGAVDSVEKALVVCVALVVLGAAVCVWLLGWQRHEQRKSPLLLPDGSWAVPPTDATVQRARAANERAREEAVFPARVVGSTAAVSFEPPAVQFGEGAREVFADDEPGDPDMLPDRPGDVPPVLDLGDPGAPTATGAA